MKHIFILRLIRKEDGSLISERDMDTIMSKRVMAKDQEKDIDSNMLDQLFCDFVQEVIDKYSVIKKQGDYVEYTEKNEWVVIMGSPAESNPVVPEYTQGDLQKGDLVDDCPAFEVHLDGINIVEVTKKLEIATTNKELAAKLPVYGTTPIIETRANSYKDTSVKFGKTFSKAPFVLLTLSGGSQNTKTFAVQVKDVSTTGMTIRTVNGYSSSVSMFINWCALPKGV